VGVNLTEFNVIFAVYAEYRKLFISLWLLWVEGVCILFILMVILFSLIQRLFMSLGEYFPVIFR